MARTTRKKPTPKDERPQGTCRECQHSYDWHNRSFYDGHLILCRCEFDVKSQHGKFCKFLSDPACSNFLKRKDTEDGETEQI